MSLPNNIILFDSICNLCNCWSQLILRRDSEQCFTLCRVQSDAGQYFLKQLNLPLDTYQSMILLERHGDSYHSFRRSEAALRIISHLPQPWHSLTLLRYIPRPARDWLYDLVARNRYRWFGRQESCLLPSGADQQRFLEDVPEETPDELI
ncbi:thiol-disulfide oxidoreductase DCC family protein [Microbulbifer sp. SSSA002]|uniref:thiol-disulfide oxidoreductase DCC family protein n=1 Tax=Microbulbifer sp. SSSA002 TaxID=3243376 RepID=UPI0040390700